MHLVPLTFVNKRVFDDVCGQTALHLELKLLPCFIQCFMNSKRCNVSNAPVISFS